MANNLIEISIREVKHSLTKAEKAIAEYIEPRLDSIVKLSLKELAEKSGSSEATVVRFCKTLGFKGYRDFIISLSAETGAKKENSGNEYTDIRPGDDISTIISNVSFNNIKSIADTESILNKENMEKLVSMIRSADRIFFFGIGASGLVCMDAYQKFMRINKKAWALTDSHAMRQAAALLTPDDIALFVSYSGTTPDVVTALNIAKTTGAKTASITKYSKNNIGAKTDATIYISTPEVTIRSGAMGSRIAMLNVIDIIFSIIASSEYNSIKQYLDTTHDAVL